jgi:hypothetical protein
MNIFDRIIFAVVDWILNNFYLVLSIVAAMFILVIILAWG